MLRRLGVSERWSRTFDVAVIVFAVIGILQLVVWFDRSLPLDVHFRAIRTLSVKPGEELHYVNYFTRHKYCETMVKRWFVDSEGLIHDINPLPAAMPTDRLHGLQHSEARIRVPRDMPPGISKSCFRARWQCNPVQHIWPLHGPETCLTFIVDAPELGVGPAGPQGPQGEVGPMGPQGPPSPPMSVPHGGLRYGPAFREIVETAME